MAALSPPTLSEYNQISPHPNRQEGGQRIRRGAPANARNAAVGPVISIVTVVRNNAATLERAMLSVFQQTYPNIEYIVVDGASTDGTLEIVKRFEDRLAYWISEPDRGIFDAMNKGVALASGDYIALLNSDDYYRTDAVAQVAAVLSAGDCDCVYTDYVFVAGEIGIRKVFKSSLALKRGMTLCHPGMFISRKAYEKYGLYSLAYKYASDFDLALRLYLAHAKFVKVEMPLAYFTSGGAAEQRLTAASLEAMRSLWRQAGLFSTIPYALMFVKRVFLRGVAAVITLTFGKRAGSAIRRWHYGESNDGYSDPDSPAHGRDGHAG